MSSQQPAHIAITFANSTLWYYFNGTTSNIAGSNNEQSSQQERDKNAVLYIVIVLFFYASAIVVGIIKYLQREKAEIEEEKNFEDYLNIKEDVLKYSRYYRMQQIKLQLHQRDSGTEKEEENISELDLGSCRSVVNEENLPSKVSEVKITVDSTSNIQQVSPLK